MNFADIMKEKSNLKLTENGAMAFEDTGEGSLLDLFSQIGGLRNRQDFEIEAKFAAAYRENPLFATKMLFYCGDVREGLGERKIFRICLRWLAVNHPEIVEKNLTSIPFYNRWDSCFELVDTPCEEKMWKFVRNTLQEDLEMVKTAKLRSKIAVTSLLGKWMPSVNASSQKTRLLAKKAMKALGMKEKTYRQTLSTLRRHLNVVECLMSAREWDKIDYESVPSYAMNNYYVAFMQHDSEGFTKYLESLKRGEKKINASVLYPYNLVKTYLGNYFYHTIPEDEVIEAQWKALPNYVQNENNVIVMADVSGSMCGRPMETSVGLAIYFAQHNRGAYHNKYMTFSSDPRFVCLNDSMSLAQCVYRTQTDGVGYTTNLGKAFDYILQNAYENSIPQDEMPKALIVISDMEIDEYGDPNYDWSFLDTFKKKFERFGYRLPKIVFWNVEARNDTVLGRGNNVLYVSGQSISTFKSLCSALDGKTAYEFMLDVLNDVRYSRVEI